VVEFKLKSKNPFLKKNTQNKKLKNKNLLHVNLKKKKKKKKKKKHLTT
jgi:hypothetical protein